MGNMEEELRVQEQPMVSENNNYETRTNTGQHIWRPQWHLEYEMMNEEKSQDIIDCYFQDKKFMAPHSLWLPTLISYWSNME